MLDQANPDDVVSTLVYLHDRVDTADLTRQLDLLGATLDQRHRIVVTELMGTAEHAQEALLDHLDTLRDAGRVDSFQPYWVGNIIRVDAVPAEIQALAGHPDVDRIYYNHEIELVAPVETTDVEGAPKGGAVSSGGAEPGIVAVRAPEVWALGITGAGTLVSSLDTGVDGNHPALASRWRGLDPEYAGNPEWAFFDPVTNQTFPFDSGSHGTHTMGSVCGGAPGDSVGVAPGAEWIHAAVIDRVSINQTIADAILSFQWMLDPDGDPLTTFDVPDVCSNSWGLADVHGVPDCDETFWTFLDACEAAGIVMLFSAGNEGFTGLRRPSDRATDEYRTVAVASVNANVGGFPISGFSSRGPTNCTPDGSSAIKPDISAPGENVRSSVPGGYGFFSGTSMASPHVNGVVALMREANPDISVEQVKQIIYDTAMDLGPTGEDNDYGWGLVDAFECVQAALGSVSLTFNYPDGRPEFIDPAGGTAVRVIVSGDATPPEPGTGMLHYRTFSGGAYTSVPMTQTDPNDYLAVFPTVPCGSTVEYYVSAETTGGDLVTNPFSAPTVVYVGEGYSGIKTLFVDDFESDNGWTVEDGPGLTTGTWERGVPLGGGDRGDPANDADGSGSCYVTGIADGDNDIDGGATTLISPDLDASDPEAILSYEQWYSNTFGADPENDIFVVEVSDDGGATWVNLETTGPGGPGVGGGWVHKQFLVADIPGITNSSTLRVRFTASDLNAGSVVEAGVDAVSITKLLCNGADCDGDIDGDGMVSTNDLLAVIAAWGACGGCPEDLDGDGMVGTNDLLVLLAAWGDCP